MDLFEEGFCHRPEYICKYRYCYGFLPMHGIMVTHPLKRQKPAAHVIVAGAQKPELAEHLGFVSAKTIEAAIEKAQERNGKEASVAFVKYPMLACRQ